MTAMGRFRTLATAKFGATNIPRLASGVTPTAWVEIRPILP